MFLLSGKNKHSFNRSSFFVAHILFFDVKIKLHIKKSHYEDRSKFKTRNNIFVSPFCNTVAFYTNPRIVPHD